MKFEIKNVGLSNPDNTRLYEAIKGLSEYFQEFLESRKLAKNHILGNEKITLINVQRPNRKYIAFTVNNLNTQEVLGGEAWYE